MVRISKLWMQIFRQAAPSLRKINNENEGLIMNFPQNFWVQNPPFSKSADAAAPTTNGVPELFIKQLIIVKVLLWDRP